MKTYLVILCGSLAFIAKTGFCSSPMTGDSLMKNLQQVNHFKGFIDLPISSLNYALNSIDDSTAQTFVQFGLAQIYYHPDQAKLYSHKLQAFLHNHPLVSDAPAGPYDYYVYGSAPRSTSTRFSHSVLSPIDPPKHGLDGLIDLLPGLNFFKTVWGIISFCCTLAVFLVTFLYVLARKSGTTFTLILNHNGQTTYL